MTSPDPVARAEFDRTYNAGIDTVWNAWTRPELVTQWWGPDNVTIPECEMDLRVGGRIYIVMEASAAMGTYAGMRWPMDGTFTTVEGPGLLTYEVTAWFTGQEDTSKIEQTQELRLSPQDGGTRLQLTATIHKVGPAAGMAVDGMRYGYAQQLDKLTAFLAGSSGA